MVISKKQGFGKTGAQDARIKGATGGAAGKGKKRKSGFALTNNAREMSLRSWEIRRARAKADAEAKAADESAN